MRNPKLLRNRPKIKKFICILLTLALLLPMGVSVPVYAGVETSWSQVGIDINDPVTDPATAPTALSISNGIPYVAYLEPAAAPGGSAEASLGDGITSESTGGKAVVKKLVEDTWVTLDGIGPREEAPDGFVTGGTIIDFSLSVYNGTPYIAFTTTKGSGLLITIMKYNEDSGWEIISDIEANRIIGLDLYVSNGIPYLAFAGPDDIYILKCNGEELEFVGDSLSIPEAQSLSLQCNDSGTMVYVSYNNSGFIEVLERSSSPDDEEEWALVGGEALSEIGSDPALFVYNQTPFVAYKENKTCIVKSFSDSQWRQLGNLVEDSAIENISLYVDSSGQNFTPYLAYEGASSYAIALKYDSSSVQWVPVTGSNSHASTWITSGLSLAANDGIPYVSYVQADQVMVMNYIPDEDPGDTLELTAKAGNKQVTLTWNSFPGAGSYKVYKDNVEWSDVGDNSFTMRNLLNGTTYQFEVRAVGDDSSIIGSSAKIDATPFGVPEEPTNVAATSGNGQATITFQEPADHGDSPITGYKVTSSPGGITANGAGTSIDVTGLTNGTSYTFIVNAINSLGEGNDSDDSNAVTPAAPGSHSGGGSGGGPSKVPSQGESSTVIVNGVAKAAGTSQITTDTDGRKTTTITVDSERLKELLAAEKSGATVTIPVKNGSAAAKGILTGEMVKNMESKEAVLIIQTDQASYTLPASQINIDKVSGQLGKNVSLSEIAVTVTVSEPVGTMSKVIENAAKQGGFSVVAPSVDFTISGTYKGSTVNVSAFNTYVDRLVAIPAGVDPERITTGVVVTPKGSTYHVPTQVVVINGVYYAKINSLTNSTYSVIWNPLEFADVAKHWSKDSVNNMGSRMVVNGVGGGNYDPNRSITRAEFAAIIVRALGLAPGNGTNNFSDVATSAWYGGYIETASSYGIIKGYDNGKFGPQDTISREQAMAMLARAMKITGLETALTADDVNQLTAAYTDGSSISAYAKEASAACLKTGIVAGRSNSTIAPKSSVTRAEVAAMMERLLQKSDLI